MSNLRISELSDAFPIGLQSGDLIPIARSGETRKLKGENIISSILGTIPTNLTNLTTKVSNLSGRNSETINLTFTDATYSIIGNINPGSIGTTQLTDSGVTTNKLANLNVTPGKLSLGGPSWTATETTIQNVLSINRQDTSSEGGEIRLAKALDNNTGWTIDSFGSTTDPQFRIFDSLSTIRLSISGGEGFTGIGTAVPDSLLTVAGSYPTGNGPFLTLRNTNNNSTNAFGPSIRFFTGRVDDVPIILGTRQNDSRFYISRATSPFTEFFTINSSGNVGINVTNPSRPLEIQSNTNTAAVNIRGRSSDNAGAIIFDNNTGNAGGQVNYIQGVPNSYLAFATNNTEYVRISANGNVGIGTTNPVTTLEINSNQPSTAVWPNRGGVITRAQGTNIGSRFVAHHAGDTGETTHFFGVRSRGNLSAPVGLAANDQIVGFGGIGTDGINWTSAGALRIYASELWTTTLSTRNGYLTLNTATSGIETEKVRVTSAGNVGIGTVSPLGQLSVSTGDSRKQFIINSIGTDPVVQIGLPDWYDIGVLSFINGSAGERMRISSSGYVGIGTTNPGTTLQVNSNIPDATTFHPNRAGIIALSEGTSPGGRVGARVSSDTQSASPVFLTMRSRGTILSPTAVNENDSLGGFIGVAYSGSGTNWPLTGGMRIFASNNWTATNTTWNSFLTLTTTTNGSETEKFRITSTGNVGIGTTIPTSKLEVSEGNLSINSSNQPAIHWRYGSNTLRFAMFAFDNGRLDIGRYDDNGVYAGSPFRIVRSTGNVGIGGIDGATRLDVAGTNGGVHSLQTRAGCDSGIAAPPSSHIILSYNGASFNGSGYAHSIRTRHNSAARYDNSIDFFVWNQGTDTASTLGTRRVLSLNAGQAQFFGSGGNDYGTTNPNIYLSNTSDSGIYMQNTGTGGSPYATMYMPGIEGGRIWWTVNKNNNWDMALDNGGNLTVRQDITAFSDIRLKEDIQPLTNALYTVEQLNGVRFKWKEKENTLDKFNLGLIAQEVENIIPEVVYDSAQKSADGEVYKTVAYDKIIPVLIEAIKELSQEVKELKSKIKE